MKKSIMQNAQDHQIKTKQVRPENKDNLDSRKNEGQDFKANNSTHNKKETKEKHLKK